MTGGSDGIGLEYAKELAQRSMSIVLISRNPDKLKKAAIEIGLSFHILYGPRCEKTCLRRFANNKDADQPAHPSSLISAFISVL